MSETTEVTVELETEDLEKTARRLMSVVESGEVTDWTITPHSDGTDTSTEADGLDDGGAT